MNKPVSQMGRSELLIHIASLTRKNNALEGQSVTMGKVIQALAAEIEVLEDDVEDLQERLFESYVSPYRRTS